KPKQPTLGFRHRRAIPRAVIVRRGWRDEWNVAAAMLGAAAARRRVKARARRQHFDRPSRGGDGLVVSLELQHHIVIRADGPVTTALSDGIEHVAFPLQRSHPGAARVRAPVLSES